MDNATPKIILHLTDLHFTDQVGHYWNNDSECHERLAGLPARDRRGLLGSLLLDLERQDISPDLVIVSGDLLDRAHSSGLDLALGFLTDLADCLRLPRNRFVLVPGNHDVARGVPDAQKYALFAQIWAFFYKDERAPFDPSQPAHLQVHHFLYEDLGLEIVGFNSCEALETDQEHGSLGSGQRDSAERLLRASADLGLYRIAVLHHHLEKPPGVESRIRSDYSEIYDAPLLREWMAGQQFRLALHGHQHVAWENVSLSRGWHLAIVAGGSAGVGEYGRKQWSLPLFYQIVKIESGTKGTLIRRQYLTNRLEWDAALRGTVDLHFGPLNQEPQVEIPQKGNAGMERALEQQLLDFLATEYATHKLARALWEHAGGKPGQVDIDSEDAIDLWRSLWRKAKNGAIRSATLIKAAQEKFPDNDILKQCLAQLDENEHQGA